ncbi:hypothetical protein ACGFNU_21670 [Spirillospora sp. NPDC048911]|uniref:hypothetical protein n=1 Tax=Spirillospora sp. NPDC048911 TaxID=3364527 RepID=UPI0037107DE8
MSDHTRSSTPALPAAHVPAAGRATPEPLLQGTDALLATPESRAGFAAYLNRLEADGYAACRHMAAYITRSRELLTANQPSSLDLLPRVVEASEGGPA